MKRPAGNRGGPRAGVVLALLAAALFSGLVALPRPAAAYVLVTIVSPAGGETWSGGLAHDIVWDLDADPNIDITVVYRWNATTVPIDARSYALQGRYATPWDVPAQDMANVTIEVCGFDGVTTDCDTSPPFDVDGTPPSLLSRSPEGPNTALTAPIDVHFSEPVNLTSFPAAFSLVPNPGNLAFAKIAGNGIRVGHANLVPGALYTATVGCGATDVSDPGLPVVGCPTAWTFRAATRPTIALDAPRGGERWSGGSTHTVSWTASDLEDPVPSLAVYLEYAPDGSTWAPIAGPLPGDASHAWSVPLADAAAARLRARVVDTRGLNATATSPPFALDATPPAVASAVPADGATGVAWDAPVLVTFSEPVVGPLDASTFGVREEASGAWVPGSFQWTGPDRFRFAPVAPYRENATYVARVNGTLRDDSDPGNPLAASEWRFTAKANGAPSIALAFPGGPALSGGSAWDLAWSASDPDDAAALLAVWIEFSDGGPWTPVAGPLPASGGFAWTAPSADMAAASLRARVVDSQGGTASDAVTFAVDATPPTIVTANPGSGEIDVSPDASLTIAFSEPIDAATASVGLRAASGAWADVVMTWDDPSTLRLTPTSPLREWTSYEVVVNGTARDLSAPGNALAATSWAFVTAGDPPTVAILDPAPGARWTAGVAHVLRVLAADARDPVVTVSADLAYDGATFLPLLAATPVANGTSTFSVTPRAVDGPGALLRVCAADASAVTACATAPLVVDATPPRVTGVLPSPGARVVHPAAPLLVAFSESMDTASVEAAFSLDPPAAVTFRWSRSAADNDTLTVEPAGLEELRAYTASVGCAARDASTPGLGLGGACPHVWTFTTAATPTIVLAHPSEGARLTGGVPQAVRWAATDDEVSVRVVGELSLDGGATYAPLFSAPFLAGPAEAIAPFPAADTEAAVVRLTVTDSAGLSAAAIGAPFAIDSTPPSVVSVSPDVAGAVDSMADLRLVMSEPVDPASASSVTHDTPNFWVEGASDLLSARVEGLAADTVVVAHATIRHNVTFTLVLDGLRDASVPGNVLAQRIAFTARDLRPPTALLAVAPRASPGDAVVLDATLSTDNDAIVAYAWSVRDGSGTEVARLAGERATWAAAEGTFTVDLEVTDAGGNAARANAPLFVGEVVVAGDLPSPEVTLLGWLALGGAGSSGSYAFTDRGRSFLSRLLLVPLYVKVKGDAVLNNETRGMIRGYILVHPGDCYTDIRRNLGLGNGELSYHLMVLEREGVIKSAPRGSRRLYYPAGVPVPEDGGGLHEIQARILKNVAEVPGMSVRDLAGILGVSHQLAHYHVRALLADGRLRLERRGVASRLYPAEGEGGAPVRPLRDT